ncbi:MAG TPA: hypothetical protein DEA69_11750 [Microbacterium sp.]|jgi:hypothetical protein|uniref:TetR-like C-terminal domain-containing protein n=1 Tax=Microbacterium TaxID=33882 RepID=UPI000C60800B|nr:MULTISPECIES: TetR-like C-terminal domain-containing protein [Microbacterium]MBU21058.1 hypothetical protein [Microbacterium sp.]MCC4267746.1 WHG domain-containing protein [Microbacterium schleiferi]HAM14033.1 hypothetical protein [Microbacterium sp.]HBS09457.1 hypothetical protein [Microbacterium sp.]HCU78569.1 hypothetical protein [Microbacterium sp.]|tara:strand:- start:3161 stop:3640 length:480 start_codon:yes stop_codon:yes gene_type:complete
MSRERSHDPARDEDDLQHRSRKERRRRRGRVVYPGGRDDVVSAALTEAGGDIYHHGVTYVTWALAHPGHYAVMWTPRLTDEEDSSLAAARMATWGILERAVADARTDASDDEEAHDSAYAAFAIVHGLAGIWLSGATPPPPDPDSRARAIVRHLAFETL